MWNSKPTFSIISGMTAVSPCSMRSVEVGLETGSEARRQESGEETAARRMRLQID
jgi:hypothetical protein